MTGMSWRPPSARPADLDTRLDPYRERGGRLHRPDGTFVADMYVQPEIYWQQRGILWWRRWSKPTEMVHGYLFYADGHFDDFLATDDELKHDLQGWSLGRFLLRGEDLKVFWLDDEQSRLLREREGLELLNY